MKMLIQIVLVALIAGGASGAGSYYWHQQKAKAAAAELAAKTANDAKSTDEKGDAAEKPESDNTDEDVVDSKTNQPDIEERDRKTDSSQVNAQPVSFGPPAGVRPPFDPTGDEAGELIYKLRVRSASASRQEKLIQEREEAMKLIVADIRNEQAIARKLQKRILDEQKRSLHFIDGARQSIDTERSLIHDDLNETRRLAEEKIQSVMREKEESLRAAEESLKAAREEQEELRKQRDALRKPTEAADRSGSPEAIPNLKKTVEKLESMPPDDTAKILVELARKGRVEAVVAMLNMIKPRISAKVISAIRENEEELAADLVERLNRLRNGFAIPAAPAK